MKALIADAVVTPTGLAIRWLAALLMLLSTFGIGRAEDSTAMIPLPPPQQVGTMTLEQTLAQRRSVRDFSPDSVTLPELAQLLWAAQGITSVEGFRTAPSAGATFPMEVYVAAKRVENLPVGLYHYVHQRAAGTHGLERVSSSDPWPRLAEAAHDQPGVAEGAVAIVLVSETARTAQRYGERATRYVAMEAGHVAQNVLLQAEALELGAVPVGAFEDDLLRNLLSTTADPLYIISVGRKSE